MPGSLQPLYLFLPLTMHLLQCPMTRFESSNPWLTFLFVVGVNTYQKSGDRLLRHSCIST